MKKFLQSLLVVGGALAVGLLVAEFSVRLILPQDMSTSFFVENDKGLVHLRGDGSAVHQVGENRQIYHFHEPYLRDTTRKPNRHNILVLGESWTFGWLLPQAETYVGRLQAYADKAYPGTVNLMNAAVPGMGTGEQAAFLEDLALRSSPDRILIFLNIHDADRAERSPHWRWDASGKALVRQQQKPSRLKRILNGTPGYNWLLAHSHLVHLARQCLHSACGRVAPIRFVWADGEADIDPALNIDKAKALYVRIRDWSKSEGVPLMVFTTGWPQPVSSPRTYVFLKQARSFFESIGVDFCDVRPTVEPILKADMARFEIPEDYHPNAIGAEAIAEAVWKECLDPRLAALRKP